MSQIWKDWKLEDFEEKKIRIYSTCIELLPNTMLVKVFITNPKSNKLFGLILDNGGSHLRNGDLVAFERHQIREVMLES